MPHITAKISLKKIILSTNILLTFTGTPLTHDIPETERHRTLYDQCKKEVPSAPLPEEKEEYSLPYDFIFILIGLIFFDET